MYVYPTDMSMYVCIDILVVLNVETQERDINCCNLSIKPNSKNSLLYLRHSLGSLLNFK